MITKDRNYRSFEIRNLQDNEGVVEGYAATFEDETVLYSINGTDYKEVIDRKAFDNTEMQDVVMNFNHGGKPVARTKNSTLELRIDEIGLYVRADLTKSEEARRLHEEIKAGLIDKMSFAFVVSADEYNRDTHTRRITGIKRLYDVSAVDFPAYESTSINARSFFEAEAEKEQAEATAEADKRAEQIERILNITKL